MQKVIVLFKTHLDVGFTDYSANIIRDYNEKHIPRAIQIAKELQDRPEGYVWTVGSYLIDQYLKTASEVKVQEMEEAIQNHWISYHGLPFTTHTELMDERLFQYGLSISAKLDKRFDRKTIAAKMTDVPGHTIAMVPYLHKAGIEFLHLGVNPASTPPDVPDLFRWLGPDGSRVVVMYSKNGYGNVMKIPYTNTYVYFAHTNDNQGPQSAEEVIAIYDKLHKEYPQAEIVAGDLDDVAEAVMPILAKLPVVTQEMGDTWIHGGATDPQKLSQYRALLRYGRTLEPEDAESLYEKLIMVPEHTWGMDTKLYLHDPEHYDRRSFEKARSEGKYEGIEASWEEQRDYVRNAIGNLRRPLCYDAENLASQYRIPYPEIEGIPSEIIRTFNIHGWIFQIGGQGAIVHLENAGVTYADENHRLGVFRYEVFSEKEVLEFQDRYLVSKIDWALEDFGKIGLASGIDHYRSYGARCGNIWRDKEHVYVEILPEEEATELFGCPPGMLLVLTPEEEQFKIDLAWFDKPALKIPEALWLGFCLPEPVSGIQKLGYYVDPGDVVTKGNQELHATQGGIQFGSYQMESLDAAIISIGRQSIYSFRKEKPNPEQGIWVNLMNNQWGTNFPMWNEGDSRFRFINQKKRCVWVARSIGMDMTSGPLFSKIIRFTIPVMLSGILQLLFNAADLVVVGRWAGSTALAAVGSTGALTNLIVNLFIGLSVGANVIVAQYFGARDHENIHQTVHTAITVSIVAGLALTVIGILLAKPLLELMGTPDDVIDQSALYMRIYFAGMIATMPYNFGSAILRAMGDTKRPLFFLAIAGILNVCMNLIFVIVFHMGVGGVALATILSQAVSAVLVIICLTKLEGSMRLELKKLKIYPDKLIKIVRTGIPAGISGALFSVSNVLIQSSVNSFGSTVMAGNTAASNLEGFLYTSMNAFHQAALCFAGQNMGAKKYSRLNRVLLCCMASVTILGLVMGTIVVLFQEPLLGLYASDPEVIEYGMIRVRYVCTLYFLCGLMDIMPGQIRGMGYSMLPTVVSLLGACGLRVLWVYTFFAWDPTLQTLYISYPISWGLTALIHLGCYVVCRRKLPKDDVVEMIEEAGY